MSFTEILNLSISASWLVLAVAAARLLIKNAPKALHCALWALVAIRLICPVSFESEMSLVPTQEVIPERYMYMEPAEQSTPAVLDIITNPVYPEAVEFDTETTVDRLQNWDLLATVAWLTGMGGMCIYALYSYLSLRLRVRMAAYLRDNVWECDELDSPFILGILRPRIYLPSGMDAGTREHVLAHENAHLKRLDHIWKPLGFALLTIHWFNPIMWLGYVLLCRDIELACDERVIKKLDRSAVIAYSQALVSCAVPHRMIAACPLAFGEVGVKGRIKSMLHYKKPGFWVMVTALLVSIAVAVCFLTDPVAKPTELDHIREEDGCTIVSQTPETLQIEIYKDFLPENVLNGRLHTFEEDEFLLHRTETTTVWLESARMFGNELLLTLNFHFSIPESGELLLPYRFENGGREWTAEISENSDARIVQYGPDPAVSIAIPIETYQKGAEYLTFELTNMNRLAYRADHLVSAPTTAPAELDAIVNEDGYLITSNREESLHLMFYTHWLPDGFESGYDFADGEMVLIETETTTLRMTHAELDGDRYRFDFAFTYGLPKTGTIYVPYFANIKGINSSLRLMEGQTHDFTRTYTDGVALEQEPETEGFSLLVDKAVYEGLDDYLSVTLEGIYVLTYMPAGVGLPMGYYLNVTDFQGTTRMERFIITEDLHLIGCEPEILFPIERDLGELQQIDAMDTSVRWALRRNNLRAWRCEAYGSVHLLFQQQDGSLYVLRLEEDNGSQSDVYELAAEGEPVPVGQEPQQYVFVPEVGTSFDRPSLSLSSDGTFLFTISSVSSYLGHGGYTLSDDALVLNTSDGLYVWTFDVTAEGFAYDAERSSPITYMPDLKNVTEVPDGELFRSVEQLRYEPAVGEPIAEAINAAILEANAVDTHASIRAASHKILAELIACGVSTEDGGAPIEERSICILGAYTEKSTDGAMTYIENTHIFTAKLRFCGQNGSYELTDYRELSDLETKEEFPDFAWKELDLNRDQYRGELLTACREQENAQLAALQAQMDEAEQLFDTVASDPLQYSNPGAYIDLHPEEWDRLLELGAATVHYSFKNLATGEEQGLKGYLMALASREIIESWGEDCTIESYFNAQNWFSQFSQQAERTSAAMTWETLRDTHPACALAIIHTQWQETSPP